MTSIYLAGKIAKNDWRHDIVTGLHTAWGSHGDVPSPSWPVLSKAIGGYLDYTGPYFASCDHGCWHGPCTHGAAGDEYVSMLGGHTGFGGGCGFAYPAFSRYQVQRACLEAIQRSDAFFAWIDDLTGYGTLTEIGYAKASGKVVILASPEPPDFSVDSGESAEPLREAWFAFSMADKVIKIPNPRLAVIRIVNGLKTLEMQMALPQNASPIEQQFWAAHWKLGIPALAGLVPQHPVGRYKIDFALPDIKVGVELDGFASHSSTTAIAKDRRRQRELEAAGWRIIRFGGQEVHKDAEGCVQQVAYLVSRRNGS